MTLCTSPNKTMGIHRIQRGRNHSYRINGMTAVGVTTALSKGIAKEGLMWWAAKCAAEEAQQMALNGTIHTHANLVDHLTKAHMRRRDDAAVRGTKIHKFAEKMIHGQPVAPPDELYPYVMQCARFMDEWRVRPLLVENVIGSYRWGYAGTFDVVAEIPDGRRILFDYKTGRKVWPETALQLAAYRHADAYVGDDGTEIPMSEVGIHEAKVVHVGADSYQVIPVDTGPPVFKAFLHVLQVAKAVDVMEHWKGPEEVRPS